MALKLWLLSQNVHNGFDTYDSCVVVSKNEETARNILPHDYPDPDFSMWCKPKNVTVVCIGKAAQELKEGEVICSSFNAG